jgi:nucleoside phosphorylase
MREGQHEDRADVLILAAHRLELEPLSAMLGAARAASVHGLRVLAREVGVGMPAAGSGSLGCLLQHRPRVALLIGSYGAYPTGAAFVPGRLLVPTSIAAADAAVHAGRAAFPAPMLTSSEPDVALAEGLASQAPDCQRGRLATTLGITTADDLANELGQRSACCGENLEALAVALACTAARVRFAAALACTNEVGSSGRTQWSRNHPLAALATADLLRTWLASGAPGIA